MKSLLFLVVLFMGCKSQTNNSFSPGELRPDNNFGKRPEEELYHVASDPFCENNLAASWVEETDFEEGSIEDEPEK